MINVLKWIWQLPQHLVAMVLLFIYRKTVVKMYVKDVDACGYVYFVPNFIGGSGISLGKYIILDYDSYIIHKIDENPGKTPQYIGYPGILTVQHEIGHSKQSMMFGPLYLLIIGLPSICNNIWDRTINSMINMSYNDRTKWYYTRYPEKWADKLGGIEWKNGTRNVIGCRVIKGFGKPKPIYQHFESHKKAQPHHDEKIDSETVLSVIYKYHKETESYWVIGGTFEKYNEGAISIKSTVNGIPVTHIADDAFTRCILFEHSQVIMPEGITHIGKRSFKCNKLKFVKIPGSVVSIGEEAFYGNYIENVILNKNCELGNGAFEDNNIFKLTIPKGIKRIPYSCFSCNKIMDLNMSNSDVELIDGNAFKNNLISELTIPDTVKMIKNGAFMQCNMKKLHFGKNVEETGEMSFMGNKLDNVFIPESLKTIENYAFAYNNIAEVRICNDVHVGALAFVKNPNETTNIIIV